MVALRTGCKGKLDDWFKNIFAEVVFPVSNCSAGLVGTFGWSVREMPHTLTLCTWLILGEGTIDVGQLHVWGATKCEALGVVQKRTKFVSKQTYKKHIRGMNFPEKSSTAVGCFFIHFPPHRVAVLSEVSAVSSILSRKQTHAIQSAPQPSQISIKASVSQIISHFAQSWQQAQIASKHCLLRIVPRHWYDNEPSRR